MSIEEATALCEQHFPKLGFIANHKYQVCHHEDGITSRHNVFCISAIPSIKSEDVRRYESFAGFAECAQELIEKESKVTPAA